MVIIGIIIIYVLYIDFKNDRREKLNSQIIVDICELMHKMSDAAHKNIEYQNNINNQFTDILKMMQGIKVPDVDKIDEVLKETEEKGVE